VHRLIRQQEQDCRPDIPALRTAATAASATRPAAATATLALTVGPVLLTSRAWPPAGLGIPATSPPVLKFSNWTLSFVSHDVSPFDVKTLSRYIAILSFATLDPKPGDCPLGMSGGGHHFRIHRGELRGVSGRRQLGRKHVF
jgi:hypothetical protein